MKFEELILGFAIGDAFGAGIEFQDRDWIKTNVDFTKLINLRHSIGGEKSNGLFALHYHEWDYSDDTEMTIGLMKALISGKKFSTDLLVDYWTDEYKKGIAENGYGRNGHGSMAWFYEGKNSIQEIRDFQRNREFPGNAPPMRAMPLGFMDSSLINQYAIINADATHPHPKARAASILVARACEFLLVKNGKASELISYCLQYIEDIDRETSDLLLKIEALPVPSKLSESDYEILCGTQPIVAPRFLPGIKGLPSDAMLTAGSVLYVLKNSHSAFEGLINAIRMGGDVDTISAICCGILSGRYGIASLPSFMIELLHEKDYLLQVAAQFENFITESNK